MTIIGKEFHFSASHQLVHLPIEHPCARLHGHNYVVVVELTGDVDPNTGFILDYRELDQVKTFLDTWLDHRHLNDVVPRAFRNSTVSVEEAALCTTAESLARFLFWYVSTLSFPSTVRLHAVTVRETPKTFARVEAAS